MKYCMKCRKGILDSASYCPFCGGTLIKFDDVKDGNHIKTCKKCNKDFPPQYKNCVFCGGTLVDKDSFWNDKEVLGHISSGNSQRLIIERTIKDENEYISIGKQYLSSTTGDFKYKNSIAIPVSCVKDLIEILSKV